MMERKLTIAEIILIAGTRIALGAGIGLLLSTKHNTGVVLPLQCPEAARNSLCLRELILDLTEAIGQS